MSPVNCHVCIVIDEAHVSRAEGIITQQQFYRPLPPGCPSEWYAKNGVMWIDL